MTENHDNSNDDIRFEIGGKFSDLRLVESLVRSRIDNSPAMTIADLEGILVGRADHVRVVLLASIVGPLIEMAARFAIEIGEGDGHAELRKMIEGLEASE
jgi:hypothetical protein